jgi:hypothetical protein
VRSRFGSLESFCFGPRALSVGVAHLGLVRRMWRYIVILFFLTSSCASRLATYAKDAVGPEVRLSPTDRHEIARLVGSQTTQEISSVYRECDVCYVVTTGIREVIDTRVEREGHTFRLRHLQGRWTLIENVPWTR